MKHEPVTSVDSEGNMTEIPMRTHEYTAGASEEMNGYVVLQVPETTYYLRPYTAIALAGALIASAKEAERVFHRHLARG